MPKVPLALRDRLITEFRQHICAELNYIPLLAQAQWWAATDGKEVIDAEIDPDSPNEKVLYPLVPCCPPPRWKSQCGGPIGCVQDGEELVCGRLGVRVRSSPRI